MDLLVNSESFPIPSDKVEKLREFISLLTVENSKFNMISDSDLFKIWDRHIQDSYFGLALWKGEDVSRGTMRVLDLGTGGGFPGIVWSLIESDCKFIFLDSIHKKVNFLNFAIEKLQIGNASAFCGRSEIYGKDPAWREKFDLLTTRACAKIPVALEWACPFLREGGKGIFWAGLKDWQERESYHRAVLDYLNMKLQKIVPYHLQGADQEKVLLFVEKTAPTPNNIPRREGIANKKNLL